jgi:WD40 repeat protein
VRINEISRGLTSIQSCIAHFRYYWISGTQTAVLEGHSAEVQSVAFSPDGLQLASGSWDGTIRLWDVMSRANTATLQGHSDRVYSAVFSPDGLQLASGSRNKTIWLWDMMSHANTAILEGHSDCVLSIRSPQTGCY